MTLLVTLNVKDGHYLWIILNINKITFTITKKAKIYILTVASLHVYLQNSP
jgi:hypothetical protein